VHITTYIDESGFNRVDFDVLACVSTTEPAEVIEATIEGFFSRRNIDYRRFHAIEKSRGAKDELVRAAASELGSKLAVLVAWRPADPWPGYDHYYPSVVLAFEQVARAMVRKQKKPMSQQRHTLVLERRDSFNTKVFELALMTHMRGVVRQWQSNIMVSAVPKGFSATLALSDLFSNVALRELIDGNDPEHLDLVRCFELEDRELGRKSFERLARDLSAKKVTRTTGTEKVVEKEVVRERIVHDRTSLGAEALGLLEAAWGRDADADITRDVQLDSCTTAQDKLEKLSTDAVITACEEILDALDPQGRAGVWKRDAYVCGYVTTLLGDRLADGDETDPSSRAELTKLLVRATATWLNACNRLGLFLGESPPVEKAEELARPYLDRTSWIQDIAFLFNVIAVSYQNVFEFGRAILRLEPYVENFDTWRSPFSTGEGLRGQQVGAFLGTYANSLFFAAATDFWIQRGAGFADRIDDGLLYSQAAEERFDDQHEAARHPIYRAQAHMQKAMLTSNAEALLEAREELCGSRNDDPAELVRAFFRGDLEPGGNDLFRTTAALKLLWLEQRRDPLRGMGSRELLARLNDIFLGHPLEQVLGYLALLSKGEIKRRARRTLVETGWPSGLVALIARAFELQVRWEHTGAVAEGEIEKLVDGLDSHTEAAWKRARIPEHLASMNSESYRGRGPLSVLPFNYC